MAGPTKVFDPAFEGVGQTAGLDVWRIEDFQPVRVPESDVGKFYTGDSYIILKTTVLKSGAYQYDVHFWLGKSTSQDEAGTAAIKTVELDGKLGDRAVQYREVQGHETDKFLSYFKPCIIPLEGGVASGFKHVEVEKFEPRLYTCNGRHVVRVKQVSFSHSSLNHDDVFILDTESKIYQFNGSTSNIQERAKALEVVQYIKDTYHEGKCDVAVISDDEEPDDEGEKAEFWSLFGGFAPIGSKEANNAEHETSTGKLYSVEEGRLDHIDATPLTKDRLESNKCYLLDCGAEIYVWTGRNTALEERKAASVAAEDFLSSRERPKHTLITRVIQGHETVSFRTNFEQWPLDNLDGDFEGARVSGLKKQGYHARGLSGEAEDTPFLFNINGKIEVWRINGSAKVAVDLAEIGKFYTGDCYIVLYTFAGESTDEYFLCSWTGEQSTEEERIAAYHIASQVGDLHKGRLVQGRIMEGKEPPVFLGLFHNFLVLKGGLSSGHQTKISEEGSADQTYQHDGVALFRVEGTGRHNSKAVQVGLDAACLNSSYCYILHTSNLLLIWNGNSSSLKEQKVACRVAEFIQPGKSLEIVEEGSEPSVFWDVLGGRKTYPSHGERNTVKKDSRLFACSLVRGKLEAKEVFNFTQHDLLSEDVMLLDAHDEAFVWVGNNASPTEKQQAFDMAQKYVQQGATLECLHENVPLFKVTEGHEPPFFTQHFEEWDPVKASMEGDSFQKRLSVLFGKHVENPKVSKSRPTTQEGEAQVVRQPSEYISYERLKANSKDPASGLDPERRESYLSPDDFEKLFGMEREQFYGLPKWKQEMQKRALDLF